MKKIFRYLNPLQHLGDSHYSFFFPFLTMLFFSIISEVFAYKIVHNPNIVGVYGVFFFVALIIYFAFREGIMGGLAATLVTLLYYIYIVITRHAAPADLLVQEETIVVLAFIYMVLVIVIGGLKQIVDKLIEKESNGRRRLAAIIEQLPVGVLITDDKGIITQANKQVEVMLGRSIRKDIQIEDISLKKSEYKGKPIAFSELPLAEVLQKGGAIEGKEFTIENAQGKTVYLQISASVIHNQAGKIIAAASIINDITRQKEAENAKDDFINMASHELKTPLTTIKVFAQVLSKKISQKRDPELQQLTGKLDGQLTKLTALVRDLLDVTKIQRGTLRIEKQEFYVKELVEEVISDLQPITSHKLILDWHTKSSVFADKEKIQQVLTNLITNATKYSPDKSKVYVGSHKNNTHIAVYVKDFGLGIPKSQQEKIFERFYQVKGNSPYPGLGLGLYISSQIIKEHQGKMWVESKEKKGSTFYFSLPIMKKKQKK